MSILSAHAPRLARAGAAGVLIACVVGLQAPAGAEKDPVGDLVNGLKQGVAQTTGSGGSGTSSVPTPGSSTTSSSGSTSGSTSGQRTSSDSDSPGYETPDPSAPDHGSSYVAGSQLAGQDVVGVGSSNATVHDDGSTSSGTTMLALGGTALPLGQSGASSSGSGSQESNTLAPLTDPVCDGSGGGVCLDVLYASSSASRSGTTSDASSEGGLADVCLGGSDPTGQTCDGPAQLGVGTSSARAHRSGGTTTAASESELLGLCLGDVSGSCGLGATAAQSEGHSSSAGTAERHSVLAGLSAAGTPVVPDQSDPMSLALAPACDPTVLCVFTNQGESYLGKHLAGHAQEALPVRALADLITLGVGQSETLVGASTDRPAPCTSCGNHGGGGNDGDHPQAGPGPGSGVLPNTGGPWSGALGLGLLLVGLGAGAVAWERRTEPVRV